MATGEEKYVKRLFVGRRSPDERRIQDKGPDTGEERRINAKKERRKGWEDRDGWERVGKWGSVPAL